MLPADSVAIYAHRTAPSGQPARVIAGPHTQLRFPSAVAVDASGAAFVANRAANSVTVYAASASGDASPTRTIAGPRAQLSLPTGVAVDGRGYVFVTNRSANAVTVYARGASGDVRPLRTIAGTRTELRAPTSIALDAAGEMFVACRDSNAVVVFAPGASGDAAPVRIIAGSRTALRSPYGIAVGAGGMTYVVNALADGSSSVTVYASRADGDAAPLRALAGRRTGMDSASGVAVGPRGMAFVSDHGDRTKVGKVLVFAAGASGDAEPVRTLAGRALPAPFGIGLGPAGEIFVVNHRE